MSFYRKMRSFPIWRRHRIQLVLIAIITLSFYAHWNYYTSNKPKIKTDKKKTDVEEQRSVTIVTTSHPSSIPDIRQRSRLWSFPTLIAPCEAKELKSYALLQLLNHSSFLKNEDLAIVADSIDTIFNAWSIQKVLDVFDSYNAHIVLSAENNCWPTPWCDAEGVVAYNNSGHADVYPNAGVLIGTHRAVYELFLWQSQNLPYTTMNDQEKIHKFNLYYRNKQKRGKNIVTLDYHRKLIYNIGDENIIFIPNSMPDSMPYSYKEGCTTIGKIRKTGHMKCNTAYHQCYYLQTDCTALWSVSRVPGVRYCSVLKEVNRTAKYDPLVLHGHGQIGKIMIPKLIRNLRARSCGPKVHAFLNE